MFHRVGIVASAVALVLAACGGGASEPGEPAQPTTTTVAPATTTTAPATTTTAPDTGFPVTIETGNGPVIIEQRPERIVSLSATATETLFAIGAGSQVLAVDDSSNHPSEAPIADLNGFTVTAESVAALDPDLVVYFFDPGDLADGLAVLSVPSIQQPAALTLDDVYAQIEQLGVATGNAAAAVDLVASMSEEITGFEAAVTAAQRGEPTYYYELDQTLFSVTSITFVGHVFGRLGMVNIADPADADGFGYPQLSPEFIIEQDPTLIFLADTKCCAQNATTIAERPGWDQLAAVRDGSVIELDDDIASRWGPRVVDLVGAAAEAVLAVDAADA